MKTNCWNFYIKREKTNKPNTATVNASLQGQIASGCAYYYCWSKPTGRVSTVPKRQKLFKPHNKRPNGARDESRLYAPRFSTVKNSKKKVKGQKEIIQFKFESFRFNSRENQRIGDDLQPTNTRLALGKTPILCAFKWMIKGTARRRGFFHATRAQADFSCTPSMPAISHSLINNKVRLVAVCTLYRRPQLINQYKYIHSSIKVKAPKASRGFFSIFSFFLSEDDGWLVRNESKVDRFLRIEDL